MKAASKTGRHRHRDSTLILVTYRHGFRVTELTALRWDQVELDSGRMHVSRIKKGTPSVHPIRGPEIRALRRLKRDYSATPYVFVTERKGPLTNSAVAKMVARAGENADFEFPVHPHMLRHATGYKLANDGHDTRAIQQYLGHKNIQHTVRYTELASTRFRDFWVFLHKGTLMQKYPNLWNSCAIPQDWFDDEGFWSSQTCGIPSSRCFHVSTAITPTTPGVAANIRSNSSPMIERPFMCSAVALPWCLP